MLDNKITIYTSLLNIISYGYLLPLCVVGVALAVFGVIVPLMSNLKGGVRNTLPLIGRVPLWNLLGLILPITPRTYINGVGFWEQSFYMTPIILLGLFSHNWFLWFVCICAITCMVTYIPLYKYWGDRVRARACVPLCVALILMVSEVQLPNNIEIILLCLLTWGLLVNKRIFPYEPFDKRYDIDTLPKLVGNHIYRTNNLPYPWMTGILHKIRSIGYAGSSSSRDFVALRGGLNGSHNIFTHTQDPQIINSLGIKWHYGEQPFKDWIEIEKGVWENPNVGK